MSAKIDLDFIDRPAIVFWFGQTPAFWTESRPFATLDAAVRFVIEELEFDAQRVATITYDAGWIAIEEVERLYLLLPPEAD